MAHSRRARGTAEASRRGLVAPRKIATHEPEISVVESGDQQTSATAEEWPLNSRAWLRPWGPCQAMSQTRTVVSREAEASSCPEGEKGQV